MYSRVCVRACLRLTAPLRREGRGGQATPRTGFPPSSLSSLPPSLLQPLGRATSRLVPSQLVRRQWQSSCSRPSAAQGAHEGSQE